MNTTTMASLGTIVAGALIAGAAGQAAGGEKAEYLIGGYGEAVITDIKTEAASGNS